jgi:hypothetical protein
MEDRQTDFPIWSAHTRSRCCNADPKDPASTLALLNTTSTVPGMILRAAFRLPVATERVHLRRSRDYRQSLSGQSERCY